MSSPQHHDPPDLLDLYLDGLLTEAERAAFEFRLSQEPELRAQLGDQKQLDRSLQRLFAAPTIPTDLPAAEAPPRGISWPRRFLSSRFAAAAAIILVLLSGVRMWMFFGGAGSQETSYPGQIPRDMMTIYKAEPPRGAMWLCRDNREFATTYYKRLGQGLLMHALPPNIECAGLSYANVTTLSPNVILTLVKVDGKDVVVFADHVENARPQSVSDPALHIFSRQFGSLMLYELTPFDHPYVLDLYYVPDMPAEWRKS
jgi:hypothetical protein